MGKKRSGMQWSQRHDWRANQLTQDHELWRLMKVAKPGVSYLYVVQCMTTHLVKIGISRNIWNRISTIQTCNPNPIQLLKLVPGGRKEESAAHSALDGSHHRGEWFRPTAQVLRWVDELPELPSAEYPPRLQAVK